MKIWLRSRGGMSLEVNAETNRILKCLIIYVSTTMQLVFRFARAKIPGTNWVYNHAL